MNKDSAAVVEMIARRIKGERKEGRRYANRNGRWFLGDLCPFFFEKRDVISDGNYALAGQVQLSKVPFLSSRRSPISATN